MRLALLFACLACVGHGRRVHASAESSRGSALAGRQKPPKGLDADSRRPGVPIRSQALAALLLAGNPTAGIAASRPTLLPRSSSRTAAKLLRRSQPARSVLGLRGGSSAEEEELPKDGDTVVDIETSGFDADAEETDAVGEDDATEVKEGDTSEDSDDAASRMKGLENLSGGASGEFLEEGPLDADAPDELTDEELVSGGTSDELTEESVLPTTVQTPLLIAAYLLHLTWVSKTQLPIGNRKIPVENIVGAAAVGNYFFFQVRKWWLRRQQGVEATPITVPWGKVRNGPFSLLLTTLMCMGAHWLSNYIGIAFDYGLLYLEDMGVPMTWGQAYAMQQLFSHLAYVAMAVHAMGSRLKPFFPPPFGEGEWIRVRWHTNWLSWVVGGFYASTLACNSLTASCHALYNYLVKNAGLPPAPTDVQPLTETVVNQLSRPGGGDITAFIIGLLAPCVSAPIFEEVLYRGFLLPTLHRFMPLGAALPLQGLLFGLHHRAIPTLLPLSLLGWLWGWFYVKTGNLCIPMLMHAMWNSRSFVNSLLEKAY